MEELGQSSGWQGILEIRNPNSSFLLSHTLGGNSQQLQYSPVATTGEVWIDLLAPAFVFTKGINQKNESSLHTHLSGLHII